MRTFYALLSAIILLVACQNSNSQSTQVDAKTFAQLIETKKEAQLIDVRTPEEVSSGYLEGALKFDFQGPNFASEIATLDKSQDYVIYCRSGNRAGGAINFMKQNGFTGTLTNAGSLDEAASATGLPVVR